ncbi:hypothetical protein AALA24_03420 [Anaerovoracaceae bacterium 42-11]
MILLTESMKNRKFVNVVISQALPAMVLPWICDAAALPACVSTAHLPWLAGLAAILSRFLTL